MVRNHVLVSCRIGHELFHAVVEEKVDEDGIDFRFGVLPIDFPPDELNGPNAASYVCNGIEVSLVGKRSSPQESWRE